MTIERDDLPGFNGSAALVKLFGKFYVVSSADVPFSGPETLVFRADKDGHVIDWMDVAGGRGMTRSEAIVDLTERMMEKEENR